MSTKQAGLILGLATVFAVISSRTLANGPSAADLLGDGAGGNSAGAFQPLDNAGAIRAAAASLRQQYGLNVEPAMAVRIAWIESSFNPSAVRVEPKINDASVGLMQTLVTTARWLATDMGYKAFGVPSSASLLDARTSLYFGMAYIDWLKKAFGKGEQWTVRAYNGGPGGAEIAATLPYWEKYLAAKARFG